MLHKSELEDWLRHPTTRFFKEVLTRECEQSKLDLLELIDNTVLDKDEIHTCISINKATRKTYQQFCNDNASELIINMFKQHGFLIEEEEEKK